MISVMMRIKIWEVANWLNNMRPMKDKFFLHEIRPLSNYLIVACLKDNKDIYKHLNKKTNKHISEWLKKKTDDVKLPEGSGVYHKDDKPLVLFIKNTKRDWNFFETLMHEINHVIFYHGKYCGFQDECEFNAYISENLFRELRQKLDR